MHYQWKITGKITLPSFNFECLHLLLRKLHKKKKGLSHRLLPKKLSATLFFFFFFFRENSYANAIFFFFFNQNIQLAYKKNNAIHSYFPFYHENFSIFSSIFAVSSVQKKKYPSPRRARLFHALQFALKVSASRSQISVQCKRLS